VAYWAKDDDPRDVRIDYEVQTCRRSPKSACVAWRVRKVADGCPVMGAEQSRFGFNGKTYVLLIDAAQDAEFLAAKDGQAHQVVAIVDDEYGLFKNGEVVYTSKSQEDD
jgi:hypothetical protein